VSELDSAPGDLLAGRFRIERVLGRGGFGITFAARELGNEREVAVKKLDLRYVEDWKSVELFEREAEVLKRLDHPRIPHYVDFVPIAADQAGLLVQELAPGRSLQAHLDDNHIFEEEEVRSMASQVLEVLEYLAGRRPPIVHRDIKPANLVLDGEGTVRVVDFGAVKDAAARASTVGSTLAGTFGYMAPEQLQGTAEPRSDLYSLGMTMIALLTGLSPTDLPRKRLKPQFRDVVRVSSPLAAFIDRLVEPVPDDRFATPRAAKDALSDAIVEATLANPDADIGALVAAKELAERQAQRRELQDTTRRKDEATAALALREDRVSVGTAPGLQRVTIAPVFLRDMLVAQLGWGFGFAFINPGVFIMMGIGALLANLTALGAGAYVPLTILLWLLLLTASNVIFALATRSRFVLDLTDTGHFALYEDNPKEPLLLGRRAQFSIDVDDPDPSALGEVDFSDGIRRYTAEKLTHRDLEAISTAVARWRGGR
jgi:hypothetical protein